jgi:hypothetical protein
MRQRADQGRLFDRFVGSQRFFGTLMTAFITALGRIGVSHHWEPGKPAFARLAAFFIGIRLVI